MIGVNFIGLRHTAEQCVPHMPRNGGAIAGISSAAGMAYLMSMQNVTGLLETATPADARAYMSAVRPAAATDTLASWIGWLDQVD